MVSKTDRRNRVKLQQLRRKWNQAHDANNWALLAEIDAKIAMVSRRLGRSW